MDCDSMAGNSVIHWWEFLRVESLVEATAHQLQLNQRVRLVQAGVLVEFEVFGTARLLFVPHHLARAQHPFQPAIHMQVSWASPPAQGVSSAERVGRRGAWL